MESSKDWRGGATVVAVVLALVVVFGVLWFSLRGGATDDNGDTAGDVATRYFEARFGPEDCVALEMESEEYRDGVTREECLETVELEGGSYECTEVEVGLSDERVEEDRARYRYELDTEAFECDESGEIVLVLEGGEWKVDDLQRDD